VHLAALLVDPLRHADRCRRGRWLGHDQRNRQSGGWLGPSVYKIVKDATGSTNLGLLCLAVAPVISAIALILAGHDRRQERMMPR
jgi:hypothetical protein